MNKLLIKFPIRERIIKFFTVLDKYYEYLSGKNEVEFIINMDLSDPIFNNDSVKNRLKQYKNLNFYYADNKNKIQAINANLFEMSKKDYDVLLLASDDMIPMIKGYDDIILKEMKQSYPDTDGVLWFYDGHNMTVNTLSIMGKKYLERFGYIYNPIYNSLWCDNEFMETSKILDKQKFINNCIIEHQHPDYNGYAYDNLMTKNQTFASVDYQIFTSRKNNNFNNIRLSILVATMNNRKDDLNRLIEILKKQIIRRKNYNIFKEIELLISCDNGVLKLGKKRNDLIYKAKGKYVTFVDDDDDISDNYIDLILKAISYDPECCSLNGIITVDGLNPREFKHSIIYDGWYEKDDIYYRTPNHWNVIKKELATLVRFNDDLSFGEDKDFSQRLRPYLTKESKIDEVLYYFKYRNVSKEYFNT